MAWYGMGWNGMEWDGMGQVRDLGNVLGPHKNNITWMRL